MKLYVTGFKAISVVFAIATVAVNAKSDLNLEDMMKVTPTCPKDTRGKCTGFIKSYIRPAPQDPIRLFKVYNPDCEYIGERELTGVNGSSVILTMLPQNITVDIDDEFPCPKFSVSYQRTTIGIDSSLDWKVCDQWEDSLGCMVPFPCKDED